MLPRTPVRLPLCIAFALALGVSGCVDSSGPGAERSDAARTPGDSSVGRGDAGAAPSKRPPQLWGWPGWEAGFPMPPDAPLCTTPGGCRNPTDPGDAGGDADARVRPDACCALPEGGAGSDGGDAGVDAGEPFSPQNLDLAFWYSAGHDVEVDRGLVTRWGDLSGKGNDAVQSELDRQPVRIQDAIGDRPALRFRDDHVLRVADAPSLRWGLEDITVFAVVAYTNSTRFREGYGVLLSKQAPVDETSQAPLIGLNVTMNGRLLNGDVYSGLFVQFQQTGGVALSAENKLNDGRARLYTVRRTDQSIVQIRVNAGFSSVTYLEPVNLDVAEELLIGGVSEPDGVAAGLSGDVAELIGVSGELPFEQMAQIEGYLMERYEL